jgi:hypothetical protein
VDIGNKTYADFALLRDFFMTVRGQAYDFRFWDWSDNALVTEYQATGDGATTFFPVLKTYGASFGANNEVRRIYKPAAGLVVFLQDTEAGSPLQAITGSGPVTVSGVSFGPSDYHIDTMNGYIAFGKAVPSGVNIFVSGSFWSVCRLGNDAMLGTMVNSQIFTWGQISIVEVPFSAAATPQ